MPSIVVLVLIISLASRSLIKDFKVYMLDKPFIISCLQILIQMFGLQHLNNALQYIQEVKTLPKSLMFFFFLKKIIIFYFYLFYISGQSCG
jgi:hypothetical protein